LAISTAKAGFTAKVEVIDVQASLNDRPKMLELIAIANCWLHADR
jgi:hypothetical protein